MSSAAKKVYLMEPLPSSAGSEHCLYRHFDGAGILLYVGVTFRIAKRVQEHAKAALWWSEVATITIERFPSKEAASQAEARAVRTERPKHNKHYAEARNYCLGTDPQAVRLQSYNVDLMTEIEDFLARTGMPSGKLGIGALNDSGFVTRLRRGQDYTGRTAARVMAFINAYENPGGLSKPDR